MRIDVLQVECEGKNEFEIKYNNVLHYKAKLPFISIADPFNLEKLRKIKIFDTNGNEIYTTNYKFIENLKESFFPMKYLITGSQKFNQILFSSNENTIKIYYEEIDIWNNRYVIEIDNKKYFCYSIEDNYIRHFPIYYDDIQIGEILKSNIIIDNKDEYYCYLKEGYESLSDGIVSLLLFLDRNEYNSSYLVNKSYKISKKFSYNKANKFYDKEWVKNNFGDEIYKKIDEDIKLVKSKFKHPLKTGKEQWKSMTREKKKILLFILIVPWIIISIALLISIVCITAFK